MLIGVRRASFVEWCVPEDARAQWLRDGGRILREEPGEVSEPITLAVYRSRADQAEAKGRGRPPGSRTRRGAQGGERSIVEKIKG